MEVTFPNMDSSMSADLCLGFEPESVVFSVNRSGMTTVGVELTKKDALILAEMVQGRFSTVEFEFEDVDETSETLVGEVSPQAIRIGVCVGKCLTYTVNISKESARKLVEHLERVLRTGYYCSAFGLEVVQPIIVQALWKKCLSIEVWSP